MFGNSVYYEKQYTNKIWPGSHSFEHQIPNFRISRSYSVYVVSWKPQQLMCDYNFSRHSGQQYVVYYL